MQLPTTQIKLKHRVHAEIEQHFAAHEAQETCLLLDSTGPGLTRQYIVLNAIGIARLHNFDAIHAFSGSVFALFGFMAFCTAQNRISIDELCHPKTERIFRRQHHAHWFSGVQAISKLLLGRSAFSSTAPLIATLETMFGEFVDQPFSHFGSNIHIYLARQKDQPLLILSNNAQCSPELESLRATPIKHIIAMAANVPFVYGGVQADTPYFDPVYTQHYLPCLKQIGLAHASTLISTPWRSGKKHNRHYVNCYPDGNARWHMLKDFARLVSGRRNVTWSRDIYTAFRLAL
ncbi:hypothetical protein [Undibacterium sp. Di24W]|uniref:hypothetical protein n=1 Tax=Undibacterium sp. Di24W TaxID=3413033 RepID=UPI003BF4100C